MTVMAILQLVWSGLGAMLRPPLVYVTIALAVLAAIWWSGERGYDRGVTACNAAHAQAAAVETTRQATVSVAVVQASEQRGVKSAKQDRSNREIVAHVKARAEALPPPPTACPLAVPSDIADSLRGLH